jgi:peroxiredoxin
MYSIARHILFVLLAIAIMSGASYASGGVKEGEPPPTFVLMDDKGKMRDFGEMIDKATVIYITHNACYYCTQIVAFLKRAETKFGKEALRIIGINVMAKDLRLINAYKEELGFAFPMFAGNSSEFLRAYEVNYVPIIVFVTPEKIVHKVIGHYIHEPVLHEIIVETMGK